MKTKRLTESAMLLALAIVLELISKAIIPELPRCTALSSGITAVCDCFAWCC